MNNKMEQKIKNKIKAIGLDKVSNLFIVLTKKRKAKQYFLKHKTTGELSSKIWGVSDRFFNRTSSSIARTFPKTHELEVIQKYTQVGQDSAHPYKPLKLKNSKLLVQSLISKKQRYFSLNQLKLGYHPFETNFQSGTSTGELSVIDFMSKLLGTNFKKVRPSWLINPKTNFPLELDGYCERLNIAIEYGSHLRAHKNSHVFQDQKEVKIKDEFKRRICKKRGIRFIRIHDIHQMKEPEIKSYLTSLLKKEKVNFSEKKLNKLSFSFKERKGCYTAKDIWEVARSCKNRNHFERGYKGYYRAAERLGILQEVVQHFRDLRFQWTHASVQKKVLEFDTIDKLKRGSKSAFTYCQKHNLIDKYCTHMVIKQKPRDYWKVLKNAETAFKDIQKNGGSFQNKYCSLYHNIKTYPAHYSSLLNKYPKFKVSYKQQSHQSIIKAIKPFKFYKDLSQNKPHLIGYLRSKNLLNKYTKHLIRVTDHQPRYNAISLEKAKAYKSIESLKIENPQLFRVLKKRNILGLANFQGL